MTLSIQWACLSDVGRHHAANEDRWFADPAAGLYVVCDGMANDVASQTAVDRLPALAAGLLAAPTALEAPECVDGWQECFGLLNRDVHRAVTAAGLVGLGTTLVLAVVRPPSVLVAHIGDSRAYLLRDYVLTPLTRDHSRVQALIDEGLVSPEEARRKRGNGGPTRFLGRSDDVSADFHVYEARAGDKLLLCSDGLTEMLPDDLIVGFLCDPLPPRQTCRELIKAANQAGGRDNITALVIEFEAS